MSMNRDILQSKTHTGKDRCQKRVHRKGYMASGQCERAAAEVNGVWCKQHLPAAIEERKQATTAEWVRKSHERRYEVWGQTFHATLVRIAMGGENLQAIAQDTLEKFNRR